MSTSIAKSTEKTPKIRSLDHRLPSNIHVFVQSTHRDVVGGFELEEPADVEREGEEDEAEDGHDAGVLAGLGHGVAHAHVALDGHGQGAVDRAWKKEYEG